MSEEADFTEKASRYWQERGGRITAVRKIICHSIFEQQQAFTADELWREARKQDRGISLASVYRTLTDLVRSQLVREIPGPRDQRLFIKSYSPEKSCGQLVCSDCQRIIPLNENLHLPQQGAALKELGFDPGMMHVHIHASCESFHRCGVCENQTAAAATGSPTVASR
ncbi:MAG: hypothetical protein HC845_01305, partial [Akkermansiaceae bacterium]|nr:hypothetical protein [Akkermansiaceae bacterium]